MVVNEFWSTKKIRKSILEIQEKLKKKSYRPIKIVTNFIRRMKKGDAVMRIDAYNQIAQIYGTQNISRTQKVQGSHSVRDEVSISQTGRD